MGYNVDYNIKKELAVLDKYTETLSITVSYTVKDFINRPIVYKSAERLIIVGLQRIYKISLLVIQYKGFENSNSFKKMLSILSESKVIPHWLYLKLSSRAKYIDNLQYDYLEYMNKKELYYLIEEIVKEFRHFRKYIYEYTV